MEDEYVYHYTSIESLALILKNHSIKFNSLKNVDDLEEKTSKGINNFGKYAFVTCWTNVKEENIALWSMYTNRMRGVRIALPTNFLDNDFESIESQLREHNLRLIPDEDIFPLTNPISRSYWMIKVNYTNDPEKICPNVWEEENKEYPLVLNRSGKDKSKQWEFQNEIRYIIYTNLINWLNKGEDNEKGRKRLEVFEDIPNELFVKISDDAYKNMKITLGPRSNENESDKIIVDALIEKYNRGICVETSGIKIGKNS